MYVCIYTISNVHCRQVNLVDEIICMLESYADNLEDLVTARTLQLENEKRKTDDLLSRMLPKLVKCNNIYIYIFERLVMYSLLLMSLCKLNECLKEDLIIIIQLTMTRINI